MSLLAIYDNYYETLRAELEARGLLPGEVLGPRPAVVTPVDLGRAIEAARLASADDAFALHYGLRLNLAAHGILGYALMSSRDGRQLLGLLARYASVAMPPLSLVQRTQGSLLLLECQVEGGVLSREFLLELTISTLVGCARAHFNRPLPGAELWLDFARPERAVRYELLKVPVRLGKSCTALVCDRSFLSMPLPSADPVMAAIGERHCEDLLSRMRDRTGLAERVRRHLLQRPGQFPKQDELAAQLHLSARSFRRHLEQEGTHYRQLVDEVRFELAKRYLRTSELPVGQIAALLAYEDPANFRRAFKRWSGTSAQAWRVSQL